MSAAVQHFVVARDNGDWDVRLDGTSLARYASCPRAIRAAVEAAHDALDRNTTRAEVMVERSPYDRYTVWISGRDGLFSESRLA
jgi:hypothetical protein